MFIVVGMTAGMAVFLFLIFFLIAQGDEEMRSIVVTFLVWLVVQGVYYFFLMPQKLGIVEMLESILSLFLLAMLLYCKAYDSIWRD